MSRPGIAYRCAAFVIGHSGMKKMWGLPKEDLLAKCREINRKRPFRMPDDGKACYEDHRVGEGYHLLEIRPGRERTEKAILYVYGGGMLTAADGSDTGSARKLGARCGQDVWFPFYPLLTDHTVMELMDMVLESYLVMLRYYLPENISFYGYSSGAATCIGVLQLIRHGRYGSFLKEPPMPGKLVVLSPGSVPLTEEEQAEMDRHSSTDIMLPSSFLRTVRDFLEDGNGEPCPPWLLNAMSGDYTGFPETWFYFGGDEMLSGAVPFYRKAFARDGAQAHFTVEPGMCHCYAMLDTFRETRRAYDEIADIIRR